MRLIILFEIELLDIFFTKHIIKSYMSIVRGIECCNVSPLWVQKRGNFLFTRFLFCDFSSSFMIQAVVVPFITSSLTIHADFFLQTSTTWTRNWYRVCGYFTYDVLHKLRKILHSSNRNKFMECKANEKFSFLYYSFIKIDYFFRAEWGKRCIWGKRPYPQLFLKLIISFYK